MPNWALKGCCDKDQKIFLITIAIFTVVIFALWRTFVLTPFKLITVFLHEASHAIACKLTCGQVEGIKVHANEGGVTQTRGGIYWLILPAGYLGSSFWGMALILASTTLLTTRIAAGCFIVALIVVLFVAKNVSGDKFLLVIYYFHCCNLASPRVHKTSYSSICHSLHWCNEQFVFSL
ncbi:hypothetical protein ACSBR2_010121 [Camellia fascicularis]